MRMPGGIAVARIPGRVMIRRVLVVESDGEQGEVITAVCRDGGFFVDVVPHESTLAHLSKHASEYGALIVRVAAEPSTLSAADRMGEFVLRYVAQAMPEFLARTIVITKIPHDLRKNLPSVRSILDDPFEPEHLLEAISASCELPAAPAS